MYGENEEFSAVFCGSDKTIFFTRKSRAVFVEFHSDSTIFGKDFTAIYTMSGMFNKVGFLVINMHFCQFSINGEIIIIVS